MDRMLTVLLLICTLIAEINCSFKFIKLMRMSRRTDGKTLLKRNVEKMKKFEQIKSQMFRRHSASTYRPSPKIKKEVAAVHSSTAINKETLNSSSNVITDKLLILSDPNFFEKYNLTSSDIQNLRKVAFWLKEEDGQSALDNFKRHHSNDPLTNLSCMDTFIKLLTDEDLSHSIDISLLNKTLCNFNDELINNETEWKANIKTNTLNLTENEASNKSKIEHKIGTAASPWKLCQRNIRIGPRKLYWTCRCQNKASQRKRYACFKCECHNLTSIVHIPDFMKENVFELNLKNFKGKHLVPPKVSKHFDFLNLESLSIADSDSLLAINWKDLANMLNLQRLSVRNAVNFHHIDRNIFVWQQPMTQISTLSINRTALKVLEMSDISKTQLTKIELINNQLHCGAQQNCWLFGSESVENLNGQFVDIDIDTCMYKNIKLRAAISNCTACLSHQCLPLSSSLCTAAENMVWCESTNSSSTRSFVSQEDCMDLNLSSPYSCNCEASECECVAAQATTSATNHQTFDSFIPSQPVTDNHISRIRKVKFHNLPHVLIDRRSICKYLYVKDIEMSKFDELHIKDDAFKMNVLVDRIKIVGRPDDESVMLIDSKAFSDSQITSIHIENVRIPDQFLYDISFSLKDLHELKLINTKLKHVPPELKSFSRLSHIDLSSNEIKHVPRDSFVDLKYLYRIFLTNNPLECSCDNEWFHMSLIGKEESNQLGVKGADFKSIDFGKVNCKMGKNYWADLSQFNPCYICDAGYDCGIDAYCERDDQGVSTCRKLDVFEYGFKLCSDSGLANIVEVNGTCNRFHMCDSKETSVLMSCPPMLRFDSSSGTCIPTIAERDGLACIKTTNQPSRKDITIDHNSVMSVLSGFMCPDNIIGIGYHSMNRHLQDAWDAIPDNSDSSAFQTIIQFIQHHGIYRHDQLDCQGYHRCNYHNVTGEFVYSKPLRCPTGTVFDSQYDKCLNALTEYMKTNPDLISQCRCNLMIFQQRYINRYREQYASDPITIPFTNYEEDPCADAQDMEF